MKTLIQCLQTFASAYNRFVYGSNLLQPIMLLAVRLTWGWQFFITGKGKLINHGDIAEFFSSLSIPFPSLSAWFIGGLECFGGLLLLVGLCSRPVALLLSIAMVVAYLVVDEDRAKVLNVFQNPDPFFQADPFLFLFASILVLAFGPGLFSIDAWLSKFLFGKDAQATEEETPSAGEQKKVHAATCGGDPGART